MLMALSNHMIKSFHTSKEDILISILPQLPENVNSSALLFDIIFAYPALLCIKFYSSLSSFVESLLPRA